MNLEVHDDAGRRRARAAAGMYEVHPPTLEDLARARELDRKFASVGLGLVDATVAALAERTTVLRVLTVDSGFAAVRIGKNYRQAIEVVGGPL